MAYTQLSPTAIPGQRYSFSAKTATAAHAGLFTELSVLALPGQRHSFSAKSIAVIPHTGLFTELSVIALPGSRHTFTAKAETTTSDEEKYRGLLKMGLWLR